jgi:membrane protease YdiL (CAAX protease family)
MTRTEGTPNDAGHARAAWSRTASYLWKRDERFILFGLPPGETSCRGVAMLAAVFFGSLAAVVALTPLAYQILEAWSRAGSATADALLQKGDIRFFSGLRWMVILLCLPFIVRVCGLTSLQAIGLPQGIPNLKVWTGWMAIGIVLVALMGVGQNLASVAELRQGWSGLWREVGLRFLQGFVGAVGEEVIFRGLVLRVLYTATGRPWLAVLVTSLFFAYTHFKVPDAVWAGAGRLDRSEVGLFIAYWTLAGISTGFDVQRFTALFALGVALGVLALRARTLWAAVGLHAGLVMGVLLYKGHYDVRPGVTDALWGGPGLIDGWAAVMALVLLTAIALLLRPSQPGP